MGSEIPQKRKKRPKPLTFLCSIIGFVNRYRYLASPNRMVAHLILLESPCVKLTQIFYLTFCDRFFFKPVVI